MQASFKDNREINYLMINIYAMIYTIINKQCLGLPWILSFKVMHNHAIVQPGIIMQFTFFHSYWNLHSFDHLYDIKQSEKTHCILPYVKFIFNLTVIKTDVSNV